MCNVMNFERPFSRSTEPEMQQWHYIQHTKQHYNTALTVSYTHTCDRSVDYSTCTRMHMHTYVYMYMQTGMKQSRHVR